MKYNRVVILTAAVATLALCLCGCQRDSLIPVGSAIRYEVSISDIATRGQLVNNNDNNDYSDIALADALSPFKVAAYNGTSPVFTTSNLNPANVETVSYASSSWTMSNTYYWPQSTVLTFFAFANLPAEGSSVAITSAGQTLTHEMLTDVADQTDILLGYYRGRGVNGNTAEIRFQHPLTAVFFKKGDIGDEVISSITLSGLAASGTVTMNADGIIGAWSVDAYTAESSQSNSEGLTVDGTSNAIGDPFILIPQDLATNGVQLTVKCKSGLTLETTIGSGEWKSQKTNGYTLTYGDPTNWKLTVTPWDEGATGKISLGLDCEFEVSEESHTFRNTTAQAVAIIGVTSKMLLDDEPIGNLEWTIKSYQIGTSDPVNVGRSSFTACGLTAETTAEGNLKLTAATRTPVNYGSHDYWTNNGGISGDTEGTGWSPKDWSSTIATKSSPLDLSKFNFKTETSQAMATANCYIVRHAGTYKIPLVYGNGVVGGNENTRSYKPTLSGNTQPLSPLVDYLNQGITSAFIENKAECVPTGWAILWQDEAVVVKDLAITGTPTATYNASNVRYLQFTVDPSTICQNNALICIYKDKNGNSKYDSGEAIWSWHIWTTNNPALLADAIPVTNYSGGVYNFFPINNIGNVDELIYKEREQVIITLEQTESGKTTTITVNQPLIPGPSQGNYYQFGRKDPMCRKNAPASGAFYIKDASLTDIYVNKAITEPDTFFGCTPYYNLVEWHTWAWPNANLWSGKATYNTSYENDSDIFKTIYDPSPVGYKVPASKAFTGFTTTGAGTATPSEYNVSYFSNGYYFYTNNSKSDVIYFPASGYRHSETGVITDIGGRGSYWTAISGNESSGYQLLFYNGNSSGIAPDIFERRSNGQSVRPVLEQNPGE